MDKIGTKTAHLTDSLDKIANKINITLNQENLDKLINSIDRLNSLMSVIGNSENLGKIDSIISNIDMIIYDLNRANLPKVINNLDKTISNIDATWVNIDNRIKDGQIDFKSILNPTLNSTMESIENLNDLLTQIKNNLNNLEDNPYEFFFKNRVDE